MEDVSANSSGSLLGNRWAVVNSDTEDAKRPFIHTGGVIKDGSGLKPPGHRAYQVQAGRHGSLRHVARGGLDLGFGFRVFFVRWTRTPPFVKKSVANAGF